MTITEVKVAVLIRSGKLTRREILHRFREHQSSRAGRRSCGPTHVRSAEGGT